MKALTSGVGIPHAFIADSESVQFARSLTMENAKFLRAVIRLQQTFGEQLSEFIRLLWKNEYSEEKQEIKNIDKNKDDKKSNKKKFDDIDIIDNIDPNDITVLFPSPAALNSSNLNDQISNTQTIIEYISDITVGTDDDKKAVKFKHELAKKFLTNIPWDVVDQIVKDIEMSKAKDNLTKGEEPESQY